MKRYSMLLMIREMQIRTTMKYQLTPARLAIIKISTNNKCWRGCGEKGNFLHCWWQCTLIQPLWRTVWNFSLKTKTKTTIWPQNPTTGHTLWENHNWKWHLYPNAHCSTVYNSQNMGATWCPLTDEWIKNPWYIYTMDYYSAIKRNTSESVPVRWVNQGPVIQSEVRKGKTSII